jgi:hypothetical protein
VLAMIASAVVREHHKKMKRLIEDIHQRDWR